MSLVKISWFYFRPQYYIGDWIFNTLKSTSDIFVRFFRDTSWNIRVSMYVKYTLIFQNIQVSERARVENRAVKMLTRNKPQNAKLNSPRREYKMTSPVYGIIRNVYPIRDTWYIVNAFASANCVLRLRQTGFYVPTLQRSPSARQRVEPASDLVLEIENCKLCVNIGAWSIETEELLGTLKPNLWSIIFNPQYPVWWGF